MQCIESQSHLIFVNSFTQAGFFNPKFLHPKTMQNTRKLQQIPPKSVKYAVLRVQSGKFDTGQFFFTGTARHARNKYEVCAPILVRLATFLVFTQLMPYCHNSEPGSLPKYHCNYKHNTCTDLFDLEGLH